MDFEEFKKDYEKMTVKEIREKTSLSRAAFGRLLDIPIRTLENWDAGIAEPPEYVITLIAFAIKNKKI